MASLVVTALNFLLSGFNHLVQYNKENGTSNQRYFGTFSRKPIQFLTERYMHIFKKSLLLDEKQRHFRHSSRTEILAYNFLLKLFMKIFNSSVWGKEGEDVGVVGGEGGARPGWGWHT